MAKRGTAKTPATMYKTEAELDKRRHPRVPSQLKARISRGDRETELSAFISTIDISIGGAYIESGFAFKEGFEFQIEFDVPEIGHVMADAEVVRRIDEGEESGRPGGFAIRFLDFYDESEIALRAFLAGDLYKFVEKFLKKQRSDLTTQKLVELVVSWDMYREGRGVS